MSNTFVTSDSHFGHFGVTQFLGPDGVTKLRPWDNIEDMDEALIENWNKVVRPQDKVYHLGDVVINRKALKTLERLNGDKVLIKGNHDIFRLEEYTPYFRDIRAFGHFDGFALTHIPIHPDSLSRWKGNIHGHYHAHRVMTTKQVLVNPGERGSHLEYQSVIDPQYLCVCVEQTNFTPISWDEVKKRFEEQQDVS